MLAGVVEIEVHLPSVRVRELTELRSITTRHRSARWKKSRATRYRASPTRSRRGRPIDVKSPPTSRRKLAESER
jgi:uncharacterized protein with von Willebrand factor type A (vWA) domain